MAKITRADEDEWMKEYGQEVFGLEDLQGWVVIQLDEGEFVEFPYPYDKVVLHAEDEA